MQSNQRIFGLDLLRTVALFLVIYSHLYYLISNYDTKLIQYSGFAGFLGVELFFALSGFLIGNMLLKLCLQQNYSFHDVKVFIKRRWYRTLPSYYLIFIANLILLYCINFKVIDGWKYVFFLQNFTSYDITFYRESWSLSIEEWTYTCIPIILFIVYKAKINNKKNLFLSTLIILIIFFHLVRYFAYPTLQLNTLDDWNINIKSIVIYRIDAVLFGMIISWLYLFYKNGLQKNKNILLLISALFFIFQFFVLAKLNINLETSSTYYNVFYFTLISITCSLALPFFIFWDKSNALTTKLASLFSKISYSVYLIHYSLIMVLFKWYASINPLSDFTLISSYISTTFLLAYLLYRYFEKPITDLRDK